MVERRFRSGLFKRLFVLCGSAALLSAAIATLAFYSYRTTLTNDRLATELAAQAHAIAPLVGARLAAGDSASASRLLRSFAGLHYVTCADMVRDGVVVASFPPPGCDLVRAKGSDREVPVTITPGAKLLFRVRVDDDLLLTPVRAETALVASLMIALATIIFIVLSLSFRKKVPAPLVALRDAMQASTP